MDVIADAIRIKGRLRGCETVEQVKQVASEEREMVAGWKGQKGDRGVMYIQINHLKAIQINQLS